MKLSKSEAGKLGAIKSTQIAHDQKKRRVADYTNNPAKCKNCNGSLPYEKRNYIFCSHSCSASINNVSRKKINNCITCGMDIPHKSKYCSVRCQHDYQYQTKIKKWLDANIYPGQGAVKRYLIETKGYKCEHCGIAEYNNKPITLELEHKDGDSCNNRVENLCFLCPNCHSQTDTYKGRNRGNGRHSRRQRYKEGKSY